MDLTILPVGGALASAALVLPLVQRRLLLSRAKHRSLAGHSRMASRLARLVPAYAFDERRIFAADQPPPEVEAARSAGFARLAALYRERFPKGQALGKRAAQRLSDAQLTSRYRVPYPFAGYVREHLVPSSFVEESQGVRLRDVDGNELYDLGGSYGVNLLGYELYKQCLDDAHARARALGPVLGPYHPRVVDVAERLCALSGMDEVTFHMSGTEAVMQAVRLARYHTRKRYVVRFCGAYHGFWGDVQPGPGNPTPARDTLTLADLSERTLEVLRTRDDIACVLVNPLQALHPNRPAPSDSALVDSSRSANFDREAYRRYLVRLREVCSARGIALIFDEVFLGFRLARGGAQEYFGVRADLVTYGKTLGGGLPVGVVCGAASWMRRFRDEAPADICFARGTFNAHPYVIAAMGAFLERLDGPEVAQIYEGLDARWEGRLARFEARLARAELPVSVAGISSVWTVLYTQPSRYNWMFQYYLRAEGLSLSWVGTGRLIFPIDLSDADFEAILERFVRAAQRMAADGFWWSAPDVTNAQLRRKVSIEMLRARFGFPLPVRTTS